MGISPRSRQHARRFRLPRCSLLAVWFFGLCYGLVGPGIKVACGWAERATATMDVMCWVTLYTLPGWGTRRGAAVGGAVFVTPAEERLAGRVYGGRKIVSTVNPPDLAS